MDIWGCKDTYNSRNCSNKKVGGESLDEIINRYIKFKAKRRIYSYADTKIADEEEDTKEER